MLSLLTQLNENQLHEKMNSMLYEEVCSRQSCIEYLRLNTCGDCWILYAFTPLERKTAESCCWGVSTLCVIIVSCNRVLLSYYLFTLTSTTLYFSMVHYSKKTVLSILLTVEVRLCFISPTMKQKWKRQCKAEIFLQNTQKSEHELNTKVDFHNFLEVFMLHHLFSAVWFGY